MDLNLVSIASCSDSNGTAFKHDRYPILSLLSARNIMLDERISRHQYTKFYYIRLPTNRLKVGKLMNVPTSLQERNPQREQTLRRKCPNYLTSPYLYSLLRLPSSSIVILVLSSLKLPLGSS